MTGLEPAIIMGVMGAGVSAIGAIKQGQAANSAAKFNAQVSQNNAVSARATAKENVDRERRNALRRQGSMRAQGGSNLSLDLLEDQVMEDELALLTTIHEGDVQASNYQNQAQLQIAGGKSAVTESRFGAASGLLSSGAEALDRYDPPSGLAKLYNTSGIWT